MKKEQLPKGTFDILPYGAEESWQTSSLWAWVESVCRETAAIFGYQEIRTPIYEHTALFHRVGETSDIVTKEMFTFLDRSDRSLTLRPEGTASVMRAFVEHNLGNLGSVHRLFYLGPMFRYERPQAGRYRQHHQFGVEAIGIKGPEQDAEVIDLLFQLYRRLGLKDLSVRINSVGDLPSRNSFREALRQFLQPHWETLSVDSQARFEKNPLRILDSKDPKDREILQGAPSILDHLTPDAKTHFTQVCRLLDKIGVPYQVDPRIVRGLDYYQKTVFEWVSNDLGAQNTIGAGGRYDGLIASFGGADLPGVGFATGLERVLQVLSAKNIVPPTEEPLVLYLIPMGDLAIEKCVELAATCRQHNLSTVVDYAGKGLATGLQNAARSKALFAGILGERELTQQEIQIKNLTSRESSQIPLSTLLSVLQKR